MKSIHLVRGSYYSHGTLVVWAVSAYEEEAQAKSAKWELAKAVKRASKLTTKRGGTRFEQATGENSPLVRLDPNMLYKDPSKVLYVIEEVTVFGPEDNAIPTTSHEHGTGPHLNLSFGRFRSV